MIWCTHILQFAHTVNTRVLVFVVLGVFLLIAALARGVLFLLKSTLTHHSVRERFGDSLRELRNPGDGPLCRTDAICSSASDNVKFKNQGHIFPMTMPLRPATRSSCHITFPTCKVVFSFRFVRDACEAAFRPSVRDLQLISYLSNANVSLLRVNLGGDKAWQLFFCLFLDR